MTAAVPGALAELMDGLGLGPPTPVVDAFGDKHLMTGNGS